MAFHTIWCVDVGKSSLKAVKLRRERNNVEILAIDKVEYPVSDNGVDTTAQAKEALSVFKTRNEVKDPLVVAHPGQGTFSRFIKVPAFDPKKVKDMVRYEASQQIPFPLDEVIWDYHVVNREYLPGEEREVGLFAVRKETIDDYLLEFSQEGLTVEMLTIGYLGLLNFIKYDINPPEPSIVLDIGATHTDLILVDGARFWIRPLPHSGNEVSKAIMSKFRLAFPDAEKLKLETAKAPQQAEKLFKAVIQPKLQELVQEVQRSIGFYRSQNGDVKFTRVYLLGNGSKVIGIKKFLEESLGVPVERLQSIGRLRVNREVNVKLLQQDLPAFGTALGLGLQAVGMGPCQVDLVPREEKVKKEIARKRKHAFIAAGILLACIVGAGMLVQKKLSDVHAAIERGQSSLKLLNLKEREVKKVEGQTNVKLQQKTDTLKELGEARQGLLEGFRVLDKALADISRKEPKAVTLRSDDAEGLKKVHEEALADLNDKLWIPYLRAELIDYSPEDAGAVPAKKAAAPKATAKGEAKPTVKAYRFIAYAVVKERENAQASNEAVKTLLQKVIADALVAKGWTKKLDVILGPATPGMKSIIYEGPIAGATGAAAGGGQGGAAGGGGRGAADALGEAEGGPFYGMPVTWYMVRNLPKAPEEAPAEVPEATTPPKKGAGKGK